MIWSSIFRGKSEERLNQNDWAQMFSFNGNSYPIGYGSMPRGSNYETISNDFCGYVSGIYKSNGVAFACMEARRLIFSEARFQYQQMRNGRPGDLFGTADLAVLEKPWPNGTTGELLSRAIQDTDLAGNHYVVREGVGAASRLRRLRPDWTDIILTAPPEDAVQSDVAGYLYRPGGTDDQELWKVYPIDGSQGAVAHWSPIPDPEAQYRGMSWLTPVLREIMADKAANDHKAKFFENAATPNLAVSFKETVTQDQFREFMETMDSQKHGVEHAYETLYLGGGADVTVIGADLAQMDFRTTQGHGETRIAAAARVHPTIVGLAEGMHGSALSDGNFRAAKNGFGDGTMRPLWRSLCTAYAPLVNELSNARLWFDTRDIAYLREDQKDVAELQQTQSQTISALVQSGYTPESIVLAINSQDWRLLEHTGLFSVQLLPPGTQAPGPGEANATKPDDGTGPDKPTPDGKKPAAPAKKPPEAPASKKGE